MKLQEMLKAIVGAVLAGLSALAGIYAQGGHVTASGWLTVAIAFFTALGVVWGVPNAPSTSVVSSLQDEITKLKTAYPSVASIADAVVQGVVKGLQTLGHVVQSDSAHPQVAEPAADPVVAETPAAILDSVSGDTSNPSLDQIVAPVETSNA